MDQIDKIHLKLKSGNLRKLQFGLLEERLGHSHLERGCYARKSLCLDSTVEERIRLGDTRQVNTACDSLTASSEELVSGNWP